MRIYFDANFSPHLVLGMRAFQEGRKSEDVVVTSVADEFGKSATDEDWIPGIASKHGIAITQDLNIHRVKAQWDLCKQNKIGMFFFKPPKKTKAWNYWDITQLVVKHWPEIKKLAQATRKPFAFTIELHKSKISRLA
jgi:hypothetical protein